MTTLKKEVLSKYKSPYFFETGTSGGDAVRLALELGFDKIFTVEIDQNLYNNNILSFKKEIEEGRVFMFLGDTIEILPELLKSHIDKKCTFWLDAHWDGGPLGIKKCPLVDELDYIKKYKNLNHTILIDDRRCFGGGNWGHGINENIIVNKLKEINENYIIKYEDGHIPNDVIAASL